MTENVTILIPTRDRPELLAVALASVRDCLGSGTVVLIGENGDAAVTRRLLAENVNFDLAITLLVNKSGSSYTENLKNLIDACATPWFGLLHDDDFFLGCVAAKITRLLARPDIDFIFSDHWIAQHDGQLDEELSVRNAVQYGRDQLVPGPLVNLDLLCVRQTICLDGFFARTELARRHSLDRSLPGFAQNRWMIEFLSGCRGYYLADRLFAYRLTVGSWTSTGLDRQELLVALAGTRLPPGSARDLLKVKVRHARWSAMKGALKKVRLLAPGSWLQLMRSMAVALAA